MKRSILFLLVLFCFSLILSACTQSEEDTQEYSGMISNGKSFGYEYTVIKEQNEFTWKIGYKGDISIIEEQAFDEANLKKYMNAVNDSQLKLVKLILSGSFFLTILITTLIFYKKNRKMLKEASVIIVILAGIAVYIAFEASFDLMGSLRDAEYYYLILTN